MSNCGYGISSDQTSNYNLKSWIGLGIDNGEKIKAPSDFPSGRVMFISIRCKISNHDPQVLIDGKQ